jgi:ADP-ribose pyrophosphatase
METKQKERIRRLVEQIRIAAFDTSESPWLLEMVAGMVEEGETAEDVARREAMEEAGLVVGRTKPVSNYLASPGGTSERLSVLVHLHYRAHFAGGGGC